MCKQLLKTLPAATLLFGLSLSAGQAQGVGQALLLRYFGTADNNSELRYLVGDPAPTGSTTPGNPNYPNSPDDVLYVTSLLSPLNYQTNGVNADRFGYLMSGYLRPTNTGYYRFAVASDDPGIFYLSTDANPANLRVRCYTQGSSGTGNFNNAGHRRSQSGEIYLEAGQYYYFEALMRDNTGGDGIRIGWQELVPGGLTNVQNSNVGIPGTFITTALHPGPAGFYGEPASTTIEDGKTAIFEALFDGDAPFNYEWYVNGVSQGAQTIYTRRAVLVLPGQTLGGDDGKTISIVVNGVPSSNAVLSVVGDGTPPVIDEVIGAATAPNTLLLRFSEPIDATSISEFDLSFDVGTTVSTLTQDPSDLRRFTVVTADPVTNGTELTVGTVKDVAGNEATNLKKTIVINEGTLRWQIYRNPALTGGNLNDLVNDPAFPFLPTETQQITSFSTPRAFGDYYGARIQGYLRVGKTGDYRIGIASDDNSALYLSPDSDPAHAQPICGVAYWSNVNDYNKHRMQQSVVHLTAGVMHYVEVIHKEGGGGDGIEVAMVDAEPLTVADAYPRKYDGPIPNGTAALSGLYLNPYRENISIDPTLPLDITAIGECMPPQTLRVRLLTGAVAYGGIQWYDAESDTPLADATNVTLALPVPLTNGTYYCVLGNDINTVTSRVATVTVPAYTSGPSIVSAAAFDNSTTVGITFDRRLDPVSSTDRFHYSVVDPVSEVQLAGVVSATVLTAAANPLLALAGDGTRYVLQLDAPVTPPFKVKAVDIVDCGGRPLDPAGSEYLVESWGTSINIGLLHPSNPNLQGTNFPISVGNADVRVAGTDIWGTADEFNFIHRLIPGDFDLKVHTPYLDLTPNVWAKSGLMARENLTPGSRMVYAVTADYTTAGYAQHAVGRRDSQGASAAGWPTDPRPGVPRELSWVRLKRVGNTFYSYQSTNGVYWQAVSSYTPAWGGVESGPLYVGICTTGHNTNVNTIAFYRDYGDFSYPGAAINIVQQPANVTTPQGTRATFTVVTEVVNAPTAELTYQWQKSDGAGGYTNIVGATTATLRTGFLTVANDNGAIYRVVLKLPGLTVNSSDALLTVETDTVAPRLLYAVGLNATSIAAVFNEPMHPVDAADSFRWSIDQGAAITGGAINAGNPTRVDLVVDAAAPLVPGTLYTLTAGTGNGAVTDVSGNATEPNPVSVMFQGVTNFLTGWVNPQMAAVDTVTVLPTANKLPLGALTERGFDCRMVQITNTFPHDLNVVEQVLAGTYLVGAWPFQGPQGPNLAGEPEFVETGVINYNVVASPVGRLQPDKPWPGIPNPAYPVGGPGNTNYITLEALTYLDLRKGLYRFGVNSDDNFRVAPATNATDAANAIVLGQFDAIGGRGTGDSTFDVQVPEDGLYPIRLIWDQGTGGCNLEFWTFNLQTGESLGVNDDAGVWAYRPPAGGTGPTPPELTASLVGGDVVICFPDPGCATCTYTLRSKDDLAAPSWTEETVAPVIAGGAVCFTVPANQAARFYQVRITP